jgi:hypothetical protein
MANVPVKLDKELKEEIEQFISRGKNRIEFPSVKNFVDKAVYKLLFEVKDAKKKKD